jgi:membrane associated rhomboid family serine protease
MAKWFDDKLDDKNVRKYTRRAMGQNKLEKVYRKLSITWWLIIINVVVFILSLIAMAIFGDEKISGIFAIQANSFFAGYFWTIFSSMFMHANITHLIANMVSLFFVGTFVERLIGRKRFLWFYIISGLFAGLFYVLLSYYFGSMCMINLFGLGCIGPKIFASPVTYAVGASGAIFALLGFLVVITPKNKVYLIGGPLIAIILESVFSTLFPTSAIVNAFSWIVTFYVFLCIFAMFSFNREIMKVALPIELPFFLLPVVAIVPLVIIGLFVPLPIGNTAHFGGLVAGMCYAFFLKNKYKKKTQYIEKMYAR